MAEYVPQTLKSQATESNFGMRLVTAECSLTPVAMTENFSPLNRNNYSPSHMLPIAVAGPVVQASALQQLTQQQALEAAACGKVVVRAECMPARPQRVALPAPPAMQRAARREDTAIQ